VKAVQFRLHQLIGAFYQLGSRRFSDALHMAIINGDDLAVALLLKLAESPQSISPQENAPATHPIPSQLSVRAMFAHIADARRLGYEHIAQRLTQSLVSLPSSALMAMDEADLLAVRAVSKEFLARHPPGQQLELFNEFLPGLAGAVPAKGVPGIPIGRAARHDPSEELCQVERVELANFSALSFQSDFVRLNRPVLLRLSKAEAATLRSMLSEEILAEEFSELPLVLGRIPYGSLFGQPESSMSLREYLFYMKQSESEVRPSPYPSLLLILLFPVRSCGASRTQPRR
jgi:hypothetical protein